LTHEEADYYMVALEAEQNLGTRVTTLAWRGDGPESARATAFR